MMPLFFGDLLRVVMFAGGRQCFVLRSCRLLEEWLLGNLWLLARRLVDELGVELLIRLELVGKRCCFGLVQTVDAEDSW